MPPKPKKCKACKALFLPIKPLQAVCDFGCAIELNLINRAKVDRKELRVARVVAKTRRDWMREAQTTFNAWIRKRDALLPCVSCQRHHEGQWHAGHYMPTSTRSILRFNELNVHKQCQPCNVHKHGNLINYRIELIKRIGIELVEWLESGAHESKQWKIEELKEIKAHQSKLLKEK